MIMALFRSGGRAESFRDVLRFTFAHWRRHRLLVAWVASTVGIATASDVLLPVFAGHLVDAVASGAADRDAGLAAALKALGAIVALGVVALGMRHLAFLGIIRLTLNIMTDVAQDAFARVQRFSTDWHASSFAGSTVRKITRGMWALDLLNDTILVALFPSLLVLVGSALLLALYWPVMGAVVMVGAALYIAMTAALSLRYVAPAARLANSWDTKLGGTLADAISCNPVVKAFGAESREDARLTRVLDKWRSRTRRTWVRGTHNGTAQGAALVALRAVIIASATSAASSPLAFSPATASTSRPA